MNLWILTEERPKKNVIEMIVKRISKDYNHGLKISDVFLSAQSSSSLGTAQLLTGHSNVVRISPVIVNGRFSLDGCGEIESLKGLGGTEARKALPTLRTLFFHDKTEPFRPFHLLQ